MKKYTFICCIYLPKSHSGRIYMNTIVFQDRRIMNNFSFSPSNIITVTIDYPCNKKCNTSLEPTFPMATKPLTIHQRHVCLQLLPSLLVGQNRKTLLLESPPSPQSLRVQVWITNAIRHLALGGFLPGCGWHLLLRKTYQCHTKVNNGWGGGDNEC